MQGKGHTITKNKSNCKLIQTNKFGCMNNSLAHEDGPCGGMLLVSPLQLDSFAVVVNVRPSWQAIVGNYEDMTDTFET